MKALLRVLLIILSSQSFAQDEMYDICPIKNSEKVPSSIVMNKSGEELDLKNYIGEKPVVLVFYRGGWCPYCTRHLSALQEVKDQIDSLGFELIAITPDKFENLDSTYTRSENLDYQLFSDFNTNAMKNFGIGWNLSLATYEKYRDKYGLDVEWWSGSKHHILPVPSVFIIKDGIIQFQHVDPNYRQRLSPDLLLNLLQAV